MSEHVVRIVKCWDRQMENVPSEILDVHGYPSIWWRDESGVHLWPRPQVGVTVLYFEDGTPAGFLAP